ncbi:MAG: NrfD/PsrC family molybdoenzyme membrane anchor subunit [Mycobacterium leprae]
MTMIQQTTWSGLIAAYLFLGGLGGGIMALGVVADLFWQPNDESADRRPAIFAAIAGLLALGIGSLLLVLDLEQPLAAIYALANLSSWITWGILFISLYLVTGVLYVLPYLLKRKVMPLWQRLVGGGAAVFGLLVAIYTGFLLSSSTGIPFWNTPALPILFVVSGTSTGSALLMLYLTALKDSSAMGHKTLHILERLDIGLMAAELVILFAFMNMAWAGSAGAKVGASFLMGSTGFMLGVPVAGLLLPLILEALGLKRKGALLTVIAALLVLAGGALLRLYILQAGYYALPYPH